MKLLEKYLFIILVFLLPTQLAYHFWPNWSFVFGLRIDILSPAIYLTDILVLYLVATNLKVVRPFMRQVIFLTIFAFINIIFSTSWIESTYKWIKVFEFVAFSVYTAKQNVLEVKHFAKILFASAVFFSIIGIFQFFNGGTFGGLLYFLGERTFNTNTPGIALFSLNGIEYLRAYSTFPHPNSLSGFMGAVLIIVLLSPGIKNNIIKYLGALLIMFCIFLSFSLSTALGLFLVIFMYFVLPKEKLSRQIVMLYLWVAVLISLPLPIFSIFLTNKVVGFGESVAQRIDLAYKAGEMISTHFIMGVGLGTFIYNLSYHTSSWILQPVHNIYLLVLVETGIIGEVFMCLLTYKLFVLQVIKKNVVYILTFVFVVFTGLFDHYWLTLQQNQLLLSLLIGLSLR